MLSVRSFLLKLRAPNWWAIGTPGEAALTGARQPSHQPDAAMPGGEHENMQAWSPEEDTIILEMHSQLGPMWSQIVRQLPGRTVSSVRNRWQRIAMLGWSARRETAWRNEAADDHARLLQCFAGADHGPGAAGFTAQLEDEIWQEASSWKGYWYCEGLAERLLLWATRSACACCTSWAAMADRDGP